MGRLNTAVTEREIRIKTTDGAMKVFIARPDGGGPFPVAVVYMDGVGYRDQIKENARRFAASGYYCVAPDLYYRAGDDLSFDFSKIASEGMSGEEGNRLRAAASSVTPDHAMADTKAILDELRSDPLAASGPKVCVGYCMGARIALRAASFTDEFVAAAGIHPGALVTDKPDSPHHDLATVRGELYYAFAEIDRSATPELVDRFRDELHRNRVRGVVERIPGVAHGFAMADLPVYNHEASEHHFERTLDLWRRNLSYEPSRT
jgi:carboxymethylenebutenolidase